jgi:predicted metalloprotease with PDZ domain
MSATTRSSNKNIISLRTIFLLFALFWALHAIGNYALCQSSSPCVKCHDTIATSSGWLQSPIGCGTSCQSDRPECSSDCSKTEDALGGGLAEALSPGILIEQRAGKLMVAGVIASSPAERAGVQAGDEVAQVNGISPGTACTLTGWGSKEGPNTTRLTLLHNGVSRNLALALRPVHELVAQLWGADMEDRGIPRSGEFSLGMSWISDEQEIRVTGLLRGGAASKSGLQLGDRVVTIDGLPSRSSTAQARLQAADHRFSCVLGVLRQGSIVEVRLASASLLEALRAASASKHTDPLSASE